MPQGNRTEKAIAAHERKWPGRQTGDNVFLDSISKNLDTIYHHIKYGKPIDFDQWSSFHDGIIEEYSYMQSKLYVIAQLLAEKATPVSSTTGPSRGNIVASTPNRFRAAPAGTSAVGDHPAARTTPAVPTISTTTTVPAIIPAATATLASPAPTSPSTAAGALEAAATEVAMTNYPKKKVYERVLSGKPEFQAARNAFKAAVQRYLRPGGDVELMLYVDGLQDLHWDKLMAKVYKEQKARTKAAAGAGAEAVRSGVSGDADGEAGGGEAGGAEGGEGEGASASVRELGRVDQGSKRKRR